MSSFEYMALREDLKRLECANEIEHGALQASITSLDRTNSLEHKAIHDRLDNITVLLGQIGELRRRVEANEAALQRLTKESNAHVADLALEIGVLLNRVANLERSQRGEKPAASLQRIKVLWRRDRDEREHYNEGVIYSDGRVHVNYSIDNPTKHLSSCGFYESIAAMHAALKETCNGRPAAVVFID